MTGRTRIITRLAGAALVSGAMAGAVAPGAQAESVPQIYWTNATGNTIGSANIDGTGANQFFIVGADDPQGIATDGQRLYWGHGQIEQSIAEANIDGTGVNEAFASVDATPGGLGLAVDDDYLFYVSPTLGGVMPLSQPGLVLDGLGGDQSYGVAVNKHAVYIGKLNSITVLDLVVGGSDLPLDPVSITGLGQVYGVAVDNRYIYWTDTTNNSIGRANLDGSGVQENFITGADDPRGIAVDGQHIYWANDASNTISEANLDGTHVNQSFITGADGPVGVAVSVPHAQVSPAQLTTFASTPAGSLSAPQTVTISNTGARALSVDDPSFRGADPGDFVVTSNGCLHPVAVGQSCRLTVAFAPQATGGRTATLTIPTSDLANSPTEIPLSGTGASPSRLTGTTMTCSTAGVVTTKTTCTYTYTYSGAPTGPTGATVTCTSGLLSKTTSCTSTYTYAASNALTAMRSAARATTNIKGRTRVVGTGSIRRHRLRLHFKHLKRGHYRLTLWRLVRHGRPLMIGRTTLAVR